MAIKAIVFDLDGTLINSLPDIMYSVNLMLAENNFPQHDLEAYRYFVGSGIEALARKSLPQNISEAHFLKCYTRLKILYEQNQINKTTVYHAIESLLQKLIDLKLNINILSNKPDVFTQEVVQHFFGKYRFRVILGASDQFPRKPNPEALIHILQLNQITTDECLYVGDSNVDMETAKRAGVKAVGVSWGFREKNELLQSGAHHIIDHPMELLDLI